MNIHEGKGQRRLNLAHCIVTTGNKNVSKNFLWFSMGSNQYWAGWGYNLCVFL